MKRLLLVLAGLFLAPQMAAAQSTIASFNGGGFGGGTGQYVGQSFTLGVAGTYTRIRFNFFYVNNLPASFGQLSIYTAPLASPGDLTSTTGLVGRSIVFGDGGSGYTFDSSMQLSSGITYYAYSSSAAPELRVSTGYVPGDLYASADAGTAYSVSTNDFAFAVRGSEVPEPAGWAMMIAGFAVAGVASRRRRAGLEPRAVA